jgi:hypothetical protein
LVVRGRVVRYIAWPGAGAAQLLAGASRISVLRSRVKVKTPGYRCRGLQEIARFTDQKGDRSA